MMLTSRYCHGSTTAVPVVLPATPPPLGGGSGSSFWQVALPDSAKVVLTPGATSKPKQRLISPRITESAFTEGVSGR